MVRNSPRVSSVRRKSPLVTSARKRFAGSVLPGGLDPLTGYPKNSRVLQAELARFVRLTKPANASDKKARSSIVKFLQGVKAFE